MLGDSAVSITSPTNSLSQTTMDMFSMTPAGLSPAAKKSWRSFKILFARGRQRSDSEIDYTQYGSSIARVLTLLRLNIVPPGTAYQWITGGHRSI